MCGLAVWESSVFVLSSYALLGYIGISIGRVSSYLMYVSLVNALLLRLLYRINV